MTLLVYATVPRLPTIEAGFTKQSTIKEASAESIQNDKLDQEPQKNEKTIPSAKTNVALHLKQIVLRDSRKCM